MRKNTTHAYFGFETCTSTLNESILLCRIPHFPIEAIPLKKGTYGSDCYNTSRNNLDCNEEALSKKIIHMSPKTMVPNSNAFSNGCKHLEKAFSAKKIQKECCSTSKSIVFWDKEVLSQKSFND